MLFKRWCLVVFLVAGTVGCDRVTKHLAAQKLAGRPTQSYFADTLRLGYAENAGGFSSLGAGLPAPVRTILFTAATGVLLALLIVAAWRNGWDRWRTVALSLFIAGGASNWVDRLATGRVFDFLKLGIGSIRTGIFNVADVAIMADVALLFLTEIKMFRIGNA
ncbi:MAG: signal peptidase II [Gammaproteobacteria bacterium]